MVALRKIPFTRMTLDEFLHWDPRDPTGARWQLIDGEPVAMAPGSSTHSAIQGEVGRLIGNHLVDSFPCRIMPEAGVVPKARSDMNYRIPDIAVTCESLTRDQMVHEPRVLIEILSPSNEIETNANIWAYTTMPSVMEILTIHSTRIAASVLRRQADGSWPSNPVSLGANDVLTLDSIGFSTPLRACYRTTPLR